MLFLATFHVQNTTLSVGSSEICVVCVFVSNLPGTGCRIEVTRDNTILFSNVMRQGNVAEGCVTASSGTYDVSVYDIDGVVSIVPVTVYRDVVVRNIESTSTSIASPSIASSSMFMYCA